MKKTLVSLLLVSVFAAGNAFAGQGASKEDLEAKLAAARVRLEQAAHDVAELSAEIGKPLMDRFMLIGEGPRRAIIGVQLDPASGKDGAKVKDVSPGGPAAEAGIRANDIIVMVNGTETKDTDSAREVSELVRKVEPESKVSVRVLRDGKPKDFVVIARPAHGMFAHGVAVPPPPPGFPHPDVDTYFDTPMAFVRGFRTQFADMELATLTPQLGRYFGSDEGVLVVRKPGGDNLLKLEDGDVILSIDGRKPTSGSHATRILRSYQSGEKITLRVMRMKKAVDLNVTLPEGDRSKDKVFRVFGTGEDEAA